MRISDILNDKVPITTSSILSKLGIKKSKAKNRISNKEFDAISRLWELEEQGLIEHIGFLGWKLTTKGVEIKHQ